MVKKNRITEFRVRVIPILLVAVLCLSLIPCGFAEAVKPAPEVQKHELVQPRTPGLGQVSAASYYEGTEEELRKVREIADQCRKQGLTDEYAIALWMHDWLVYNANYDYTYSEYFPEGVLLKGTGVCQSYALAFELLMREMGIECDTVFAYEMDHSWNVVKLNGQWCHVDCTWDDPDQGSNECYTYFGLNDKLMSMDHQWPQSSYPSCTSLENYYPYRAGIGLVSSQEELDVYLNEKFSAKQTEIECIYMGDDKSFDAYNAFVQWWNTYYHLYEVEVSLSCTQYYLYLDVTYFGSTTQPETPQKLSFNLEGLAGIYRSEDYIGNTVMLVCGGAGSPTTDHAIGAAHMLGPDLYASGVEILVSLEGIQNREDLLALQPWTPNAHITCGDSTLRQIIVEAADAEYTSPYFPAIAVIDSRGNMVYCQAGPERYFEEVIDIVRTMETGKSLPVPVTTAFGGDANAALGTRYGSASAALAELSKDHNGVLFMHSDDLGPEEAAHLAAWNSCGEILSALDIKLAVSLGWHDWEKLAKYHSAYPNVTFLPDNDYHMFSDMLGAVQGFDQNGGYLASYLIDHTGTIVSYRCGGMLDAEACAAQVARWLPCDAVMPTDLTQIKEEAFRNVGIKKVDLTGSGIITIGAGAFADNEELTVMIIPDSVTEIGENAFAGCDKLVILCGAESAAYQYAVDNHIAVLVI